MGRAVLETGGRPIAQGVHIAKRHLPANDSCNIEVRSCNRGFNHGALQMPPNTPECDAHPAPACAQELAPGERLIRLSEVLAITGESKTTAYENMASPDPESRHPLPIKDGRASLFVLSEVHAYIAGKIARLPRKG